MRPVFVAAGVVLAGVCAAAAVQSQRPLFRAKTDLVELDVTVLDKDHQPVHGLTEKDFTILEDGKPQTIAAFDAVDLPTTTSAAAPAKWMATVSPDVTTNTHDDRRLVVIVLDDATMRQIQG